MTRREITLFVGPRIAGAAVSSEAGYRCVMARRLEPGELLTRPSPWLGVGGAAVVIGDSVTSFHRSAPLAAYFAVVAFTAFTAWSLVMVATGFYISFFARVVGALLVPVTSLEQSRGIEMGPSWLWELLSAGVFFGLLYAGRAGRQQARDEATSALVEQLRSGVSRDDIPPFCLYLRPFEITNRLPTRVSDAGVGEKGEAVDVESLLADSLAPQYTLVALGQPGEIYGAGRLLASEDAWRGEFRRLAAAADFIFLLPSANPGTFEEITWLAEHGLIDRYVWLMPVAVEPDALADTGQREQLESSWERARSACAKLGLKLPPYDARGFLVRTGRDGGVLAMEPSAPGFWAKAGLRRSLCTGCGRPEAHATCQSSMSLPYTSTGCCAPSLGRRERRFESCRGHHRCPTRTRTNQGAV